jgi:O-antigen/teichoic acid export membrane protein
MRKLISDTGAVGASHGLSAAVQLGVQILIVRVLTPADFGRYVAALAFVTLAEAVFVSRSGELALQFVGSSWVEGRFGDARRAAARVFRQDVIIQTTAFFLLIVLALGLRSVYPLDVWIVTGLAAGIPAQIGYGVYKSIFISSGRLKDQAMFESATVLAQSALGAAGVLLAGIAGLVVGQVAGTGLKNLLAWAWTRRWWPDLETSGSNSVVSCGNWRAFTILSLLRNSFVHASSHLDVLILNGTVNPGAVAVYKVARSLAAVPVRVAQPLWVAVRPTMMLALAQRRPEQVRRLIVLPAVGMLGALAFAIWPLSRFGGEIVTRLYGNDYAAAGTPFVLLMVGTWIFGSVTGWLGFWVVVSEERRSGTWIFGLLLGLIAFIGGLYGSSSPIRMAIAVAASMVLTSAVAWLLLARSLDRLVGREVSQ